MAKKILNNWLMNYRRADEKGLTPIPDEFIYNSMDGKKLHIKLKPQKIGNPVTRINRRKLS